MAGLRVVPGNDWKWGDQDGGEGHLGTATGNDTRDGWVHILWDSGRKNNYRMEQDLTDLAVLDNGPAGI